MFAVIQENRLLGMGDTPLEAWIAAYEALGRPLGPEDADAFCEEVKLPQPRKRYSWEDEASGENVPF